MVVSSPHLLSANVHVQSLIIATAAAIKPLIGQPGIDRLEAVIHPLIELIKARDQDIKLSHTGTPLSSIPPPLQPSENV
jgi:hypothetical protein